MTSRSRRAFWGLAGTLTVVLGLAVSIVYLRVWRVENAEAELASHDIFVLYRYAGPDWLIPILPLGVIKAWLSEAGLGPMRDTLTDADWKTAIAASKTVPNVTSISFSGCDISQVTISSLTEFQQLRSLDLSMTEVTGNDIAFLTPCTQLEELSLRGTRISDEDLSSVSKLSKLKELDLTYSQITEKGLVHLRKLTSLRHLNLMWTVIPMDALESLEKDMPQLTITHD